MREEPRNVPSTSTYAPQHRRTQASTFVCVRYDELVFERKTTGSVVCPSCGSLVGVRDDKCYSCGRANPGLWGFGPALRKLGVEFGFGNVVIGACVTLYAITLLMSGNAIFQVGGGIMSLLAPSTPA